MSRTSRTYRTTLMTMHIVQCVIVAAVTYFAARLLSVDVSDAGACATLNGGLCYFERDASQRVADAILHVVPLVKSPRDGDANTATVDASAEPVPVVTDPSRTFDSAQV